MTYEEFERLLAEKGVKVSEVAKATGISQSTFSDWKAGRYTPKAGKFKKIEEYFGITSEENTEKESILFRLPKFMDNYNRAVAARMAEAFATDASKIANEEIMNILGNDERTLEMVELFRALNNESKDSVLNFLRYTASNPDNLTDAGSQGAKEA